MTDIDIWEDDEIVYEKEKLKNSTDVLIRMAEMSNVVCIFIDTKEDAIANVNEIKELFPKSRTAIFSGLSRSFLYQRCNTDIKDMFFVRENIDEHLKIEPAPDEVLIVWNFFEFENPEFLFKQVEKPWKYIFFISIVDFLHMSKNF